LRGGFLFSLQLLLTLSGEHFFVNSAELVEPGLEKGALIRRIQLSLNTLSATEFLWTTFCQRNRTVIARDLEDEGQTTHSIDLNNLICYK
jgi:hypothetical protein